MTDNRLTPEELNSFSEWLPKFLEEAAHHQETINRQKAEIDDLKRDTIPKLQSSLERANRYGLQVDEENKMLKAEIARLQENIAPPYLLINCDDKSAEELRETLKTQKPVVDNLVEEMVGEE